MPVILMSRLIKCTVNIPEEVTQKTKITNEMVNEFGINIKDGLAELSHMAVKARPSYILAHNGRNFDFPLLDAEINRNQFDMSGFMDIPRLDTRTDLPFSHPPESMRLNHLAMDMGVINHFKHRAVTDVLTMLCVFSQFPIEDIVAYSKIPTLKIRALTNYDQKELAKARSFLWDGANKIWSKDIKEDKLQAEIEKCKLAGFEIVVL